MRSHIFIQFMFLFKYENIKIDCDHILYFS